MEHLLLQWCVAAILRVMSTGASARECKEKNRWSRVCCVWSSWRDLLKIVHTLNVSCLVIWCVHLSNENSSNTAKYNHNHWIMDSWCHLQNSFFSGVHPGSIFNKIRIMHRMIHWLGKYVSINFKFYLSLSWTS